MTAVGLPALTPRLDEEDHWNRILSLGEQQRLGVARALLHRPDYLFLDEATASLDEPSEDALYRLIAEKLPATTVVSIGHRSTLDTFHQDKVALEPAGDRFAIHSVKEPARAALLLGRCGYGLGGRGRGFHRDRGLALGGGFHALVFDSAHLGVGC